MNDEIKEMVAEFVYDFVHENQVTHRKLYSEIPDDYKKLYQKIAHRITTYIDNKTRASAGVEMVSKRSSSANSEELGR